VTTYKWIFSQQHGGIQVDKAKTAQASDKMGGGANCQA